jgi:CHAT domain-containing protein
LKTIISEIRHALGREDASDRDLYEALSGFHANPRPGQRYALLLVVGVRLSERGLQYASAAMIREAVLEAGLTGREKDLPEALTRLASAEASIGDVAAAKRTIARIRELLPSIPDSVMHSRLDAELARTEARVYEGEDRTLAVDRLGKAISYFAATEIPTDEANLRVERAGLLLSLGDSAAAERDLAGATSTAAMYIGRNPSRASSRVWLSTQRQAYHQLVSIALARGDTNRAYEYTRSDRKGNVDLARGDAVVIESVVLDRQTLIWTTSGSTRRLTVVPAGDSTLSDLVARFTNLVRQNEDTLAELALGRRLNELLVAPVRASIRERVVIVPDGPLRGLPFAALRDSSGQYLIEDVALAYSDGRGGQGKGADHRAFTDALFVGSPSWDRGLFPDLEPLREVEREVGEASAQYPRRVILGDSAANRAGIVKELSLHDVVHFAGHARVVDDNPGASHLVLAKQPGGFAANVLSATEIAAMRLNRVRLVVLSACGSTGSRFGRAASNGLAEAFLDAGVGSVIANDWEADDAGAAALTPVLHRELRNGAAADEALRRAQVAMLRSGERRFSAPAVWSGFRVVSSEMPEK